MHQKHSGRTDLQSSIKANRYGFEGLIQIPDPYQEDSGSIYFQNVTGTSLSKSSSLTKFFLQRCNQLFPRYEPNCGKNAV